MAPQHRVLVGMSGGVDSAVAALLLREQGYAVHGAFLHLWSEEGIPNARENACCSTEGMERARRTCDQLGIPFVVLNVADRFKERIVDPWIRDALATRTPNPCLACNREIKVGFLLERAEALDCAFVATGHYARIVATDDGQQLYRATDRAKDQSYTLARLAPEQLARLLLPLGALTKTEVRARAAAAGLHAAAHAKESQQLSFVADDVPSFLRRQAPDALTPGAVRDLDGREYHAPHDGLALYTIGQRKGLPVSGTGTPRYVVRKDAATNTLVLGEEADLFARTCTVEQLVVRGAFPERGRCMVQIRAHAAPVPAIVERANGHATLTFDAPQRALVPGQEAVLYDDERCMGSGTIVGVAH